MLGFRQIWQLLKATWKELQLNEVSLLASSLAYFTLFSIAPLMIVVITILGVFFGEAAVEGELVGAIQGTVGQEGAQFIETAIANTREETGGGTLQLIFNIGLLLFGASGVFAQIQRALDRIWEVKPEPKRHIFHFIRKRVLSFSMVLVIAFLLLVTLVLNTALATLFDVLSGYLPGLGYLWQVVSFIVSFVIVTFLFGAIYMILPDAKVAWRDAVVGATVTAILFLLGQFLFGLFIDQTGFGSAYGFAGSVIIFISWIYYNAHILFIGAEFTQVYARKHGSKIVPEDYAVHRTRNNPESEQESQEEYRLEDPFSQPPYRKRKPLKRRSSRRKKYSDNFSQNLLPRFFSQRRQPYPRR